MTNAQTESPMAASADEKTVAAVCDKRGPDAARMEAHLKSEAITAKWYALRDLADLDRDVREGRVGGVVFVRAADLLEGIFNNEIKYSDWVTASVPVSFLDSPDGDRRFFKEKLDGLPADLLAETRRRNTEYIVWLARCLRG